MKMSLVVPCYNEEEAIPIFYREALKVIEQLKDEFEFEFCFVDDGSPSLFLYCGGTILPRSFWNRSIQDN